MSAAPRDWDVLDRWLTEIRWDENYWDEEAAAIVQRVGASPTQESIRGAIPAVLAESFGGFRPARSVGGSKADLLDRMADQILTDKLRD